MTGYDFLNGMRIKFRHAVESQKGANVVQRCSTDNQNGAITVQWPWRQRPSGYQQKKRITALTPFYMTL